MIQALLIIIIILILTIITYSLYCRFNYAGRLLAKIPGPKGVPVFENLFYLFGTAEEIFQINRHTFKTYGKTVKMFTFHYRFININRPEDLEIILSSVKFNEKQIPYTFLRPWLGTGLLISNGDLWHKRRKMLTPAFHFNILKKYFTIFVEETETFLKQIQGEVLQEKSDITPLIMNSTLRTMCRTAMEIPVLVNFDSVCAKYLDAVHKLGASIVYRLTRPYIYIDAAFNLTKTFKSQKTALKDLHKFTKGVINKRRLYRDKNSIYEDNNDEFNNRKHKMAMLDLLLEQEKLENIDEDGIREEVDTFMFEGHDTTAAALQFIILSIANEQEIQNNIYEELSQIFGDSPRSPTMDDINKMQYLECCIKESLRLYPSVPYIARYITEEVVLDGYRVPPNTICNINIWDTHRDKDLYPDPEKFIPERFLPENCHKRHRYAYIPFSAGPRNCIGQKFALLELKTLMSGLIRRFRLEPVTAPSELIFVADLVVRTKNPIYVRFRDRNLGTNE